MSLSLAIALGWCYSHSQNSFLHSYADKGKQDLFHPDAITLRAHDGLSRTIG